jgi:hypothetical protein
MKLHGMLILRDRLWWVRGYRVSAMGLGEEKIFGY